MAIIDELLSGTEQIARRQTQPPAQSVRVFDIKIMNRSSGAKSTMPVTARNTLGQIATSCEDLIGIDPRVSTYVFENAQTRQTTSDLQMTLGEFGFTGESDTQDCVLVITDDGSVAGGEEL